MGKRPAEIHATNLRDDLIALVNLIGGKPGAETDEADARSRLIGRIVSHLSSLVRDLIEEHDHRAFQESGVGPDGTPYATGGRRVTWVGGGGMDDPLTEVERLGRLIAEWWSDPDNPPSGVVPVAKRYRPDLFGPAESDSVASPRTRPGKDAPTPPQVCDEAAAVLAEAGLPGYSPLSIVEGIRALIRLRAVTHAELLTAQASARQHLEASSHRAQIAEHYRAALQRIADGPSSPHWRTEARAALVAPEWDRRIRS